jgi:bidirectional [NiFe] hydrogenase diaphorase subunit
MLLDKIVNRKATEEEFELLKELCVMVKETSLCGLGQAAPNPVLSTIRFFKEEYISKLKAATEFDTSGNGHTPTSVAKEA